MCFLTVRFVTVFHFEHCNAPSEHWPIALRIKIIYSLLGAFAKFWKAAISFVMCLFVCPSVRMQQLGSHLTDFHEIWYLIVFLIFVEKIQVSLISDKNIPYFTWNPCKFMITSLRIRLRMRTVSYKTTEEIKTCGLRSVTVFWKSRLLCDNMENYDRAGQATEDNMAHARCLLDTKGYKYTLRMCNNFFPQCYNCCKNTPQYFVLLIFLSCFLCFYLVLECFLWFRFWTLSFANFGEDGHKFSQLEPLKTYFFLYWSVSVRRLHFAMLNYRRHLV